MVRHILKGGEDSIGIHEAVQRVYFNIGSCSEQCWVNHLTDLRQLDPNQRGFGQTPFDIGQCRRDCPNFRAIEDRLDDIVAFLRRRRRGRPTSTRPGATSSPRDLEISWSSEFGAGAIERGRAVFAANCARCHSAQSEPFEQRRLPRHRPATRRCASTGWATTSRHPSTEVGTHYRCRALHSNHMAGHVWQEYGSQTYARRPPDADLERPQGRRARLLPQHLAAQRLGARAVHAQQRDRSRAVRRPRTTPTTLRLALCRTRSRQAARPTRRRRAGRSIPSVKGRFKLFKASMERCSTRSKRTPKVSWLSEELILDVGPEPGR